MKTRLLIIFCVAFNLTLLSCGTSTNIEPDDIVTPTTPTTPTPEINSDSVTISINSSIKFDTKPLSSRSSSLNDLYALQVHQIIPEDNGCYLSLYAYGYFDDLNKIVISLAKRYKYSFTLAYIPNGKNVIYKYPDGHYGNPCSSLYRDAYNGELNDLVYSTTASLDYLFYGTSQAKRQSSASEHDNWWNDIERYQGVCMEFDPNINTTVNIDLYRMMVGFKVTITDFYEGVVNIHGMYGNGYEIKPHSTGTSTIDFIIESPIMPYADMPDYPYDGVDDIEKENIIKQHINECTDDVSITYTDEDGNCMNLYTQKGFIMQRNTKYILKFSLSEAITNGGITANIIQDEEMKEENFPL